MNYDNLDKDQLIALLKERETVPPKNELLERSKKVSQKLHGLDDQLRRIGNQRENLLLQIENLHKQIAAKNFEREELKEKRDKVAELAAEARVERDQIHHVLAKYYDTRPRWS